MTAPRFDGKTVLVTGAAQGMGKVIAQHLASLGARVVVNDRKLDDRLSELATEIGGYAAPADLSKWDEIDSMISDVSQNFGVVDVLVANHAYMTMNDFLTYDSQDWWKVVDTNLGGTFRLIQKLVPGMRASGAGRIVVTSSIWGVTGWPQATAYSASKAGLISMVKTLGRELAPDGIIINAIAPGIINTPQLQVDADAENIPLEQMHELYAKSIPLGRIGQPIEIAKVVAFLADFNISSIVGQTVQANGGEVRSRV
jgi:NAD(P)-dependent dehydrogenase (short-subunit alcohol dehydrogenase family)